MVKAFCSIQRMRRHLSTKGLQASSLSPSSCTDIAIVGGGLAGLALAHNLLQESGVHVTIYDKAVVGQGGASSVAGGLLHPLSPRGKVVHWGLEGLASTSRLVDSASCFSPHCVLRDKLYRVALTEENVATLKATASLDISRWMEKDEMDAVLGSNSMGGLELSNGCRVIHVPSYLEGLYAACQELGSIEWRVTNDLTDLAKHEVIVWAGGAGMLQDGTLDQALIPVELVRGQSLEMKPTHQIPREAALCGKYISPLLDNCMLVGASHEFSMDPITEMELYNDLKEKSYDLAPGLWENSTVERVTCGWRVQSKRGGLGRLPIVGHLSRNQWIYTGLSSRGLLYHAIYAEKLCSMILSGDYGEALTQEHSHLNWWRCTSKSSIKN
ncbi:FAD dependent oxidoreductase [Fragilaria crotonensis]|nr:FAD dependent oxidoreductase [Fragilaria crotonensis]